MLKVLTGIIASTLLVINILFTAALLFPVTLLKVLIPVASVRNKLTTVLTHIAENWICGNKLWMRLTQPMQWKVSLPAGLSNKDWYFVLSNHQSWVDILVLQSVFNRKIPLLKFFLKEELRKIPIMGTAWWALDFPFMKRYSKSYLEKHPEKKGQDIETTRIACEKFKLHPTSVMNFLEGTRFTKAKHESQESPFKFLLKPKSGGMAFAINAMGDQFKSILDVTIHYPAGVPTFWEFLKGNMKHCRVEVTRIMIPEEIRQGDYDGDLAYRQAFQQWTHDLWAKKDSRLAEMDLEASQ